MLWFVTKWRTYCISFCEIICIWVQMHLSNAGVNCISMEYEVVGSVLGVTAGTRITNANLRQSIYPMFLQCAYNVLTMCDVWGHGSPKQIFVANWVMRTVHCMQSFPDVLVMFVQCSYHVQFAGTRAPDAKYLSLTALSKECTLCNVHLMFLQYLFNVLAMLGQCLWNMKCAKVWHSTRNLQCREQHDDNSTPSTTVYFRTRRANKKKEDANTQGC